MGVLEWSEWSSCSASCGPATQSRWSRCTDTGAMMDCIQAGMESKVTRACRLPPCTNTTQANKSSHVTAQDIAKVRNKALHYEGPCQCQAGGSGFCRPGSPVCVCSHGWTGSGCITPVCRQHCRNGALCVRPDVCACNPGYTGARCQDAFCHPACQHGGECVAPFQCRCPQGSGGQYCELLSCSPPCAHGGVCLPGGSCSCPEGYSGLGCLESTCTRVCHNGGICTPGSGSCTCTEGFYGLNCQQRSCLDYVSIREPRRTGYRRVVSLGEDQRPVYKIYYRTVYRTVTKCKEDLT